MRLTQGLVLLGALLACASSRRFGYSARLQKEWGRHSEACKGHHQSPIGIDTGKAIPLSIPALEMVGFHNLLPRPITASNNGHSVEIKSVPGKHSKIFGALLNGVYNVEALHFHWGSQNNRGSEHVIDDVRYPMEMHIVTKNHKYSTVSEALQHSDGLAVMAFFFQVHEKRNKALDPILEDLELVQALESNVYLSNTFTLASLIPKEMDTFYTYRGSLTTPPCSEAVTWLVFPDFLSLSYKQMMEFRRLSSGSVSMSDNYRLLQPLGNRRVYVRRRPSEFQMNRNTLYNFSTPYFWDSTPHTHEHDDDDETPMLPEIEENEEAEKIDKNVNDK